MTEDKSQFAYLGDGLYVYYTGHSFELRVNDHRNPTVASFEPQHIENFKDFKDRMLSKNFTADKRAEIPDGK